MTRKQGKPLVFRDGDEGVRHYLDERGVHADDILELRLFDEGTTETAKEKWVSGRYEWTGRREDAPSFFVFVGWWSTASEADIKSGDRAPAAAQAVLRLSGGSVLRWPEVRR